MPTTRLLLLASLCLALAACGRRSVRPEAPTLTLTEATALLPSNVKDREGWARDVLAALEAHEQRATAESLCSVLAVIEQESGFEPNPVVPDLARIVRRQLEAHVAKLGPLGPRVLSELLSGTAPGDSRTFEQRMDRVRTERDVDVLFRDLLASWEDRFPTTFKALSLASELFTSRSFEAYNPVTTAGSMQVSVRFATELAEEENRPIDSVREALYTRAGGVYYGTARLLGFEAGYEDPLYRFADYNAGLYASRNAAFQEQVAQLAKFPLALDGDLLAYDKAGEPLDTETKSLRALLIFRLRHQHQQELSERRIRKDVRDEKKREFEESPTWRAVKKTYETESGRPPAYARLPDVQLVGPKMKSPRSTAWFARSVERRYRRCLERAPQRVSTLPGVHDRF